MAEFALEQSPGHLLRRAQQYADDLYKKEVGASGPTARQFTVLHTVSKDEGLSQTDLVRRTGIDRSTLADMIARLTAKGYLARQRTKSDARANAVKLTAAGRKVLKSAENKVLKAEEEALSMLPKTQQSSFMKNLRSYAEALDKIEAEQMAPKRQPAAAKPAAKKATKKKAAKKTAAKKSTKKSAAAATKAAAPAKKAPRKAAAKKARAPKATKTSTTRKTARKASRRATSASTPVTGTPETATS
jgi:DNA-binding MarR family transcriptional regulator